MSTEIQKESTLEAIGYICQDIVSIRTMLTKTIFSCEIKKFKILDLSFLYAHLLIDAIERFFPQQLVGKKTNAFWKKPHDQEVKGLNPSRGIPKTLKYGTCCLLV